MSTVSSSSQMGFGSNVLLPTMHQNVIQVLDDDYALQLRAAHFFSGLLSSIKDRGLVCNCRDP